MADIPVSTVAFVSESGEYRVIEPVEHENPTGGPVLVENRETTLVQRVVVIDGDGAVVSESYGEHVGDPADYNSTIVEVAE